MVKPEVAAPPATDEDVVASRAAVADAGAKAQWEAQHDLDRYRAETERLRALIDFLNRPVHAPGGAEPDPDIVVAYNLAVEAALRRVRRAAGGT